MGKKVSKEKVKGEDEESTVPLKPDWMDKPKDKFPARKSAKEVGKNPTRKTAKQIRGEEDEESSSIDPNILKWGRGIGWDVDTIKNIFKLGDRYGKSINNWHFTEEFFWYMLNHPGNLHVDTNDKNSILSAFNKFKTMHENEEDEQSISKQMKKTGKATIKGPNVKERKKFAPATKVETPKKGKGSYDRKKALKENNDIASFIDSIITKNYADADKYIKQAVESKIQSKIEQELSTPLF